MDLKFTVPEISCGHSKETIEKALDVTRISNINIDIDSKAVSLNISEETEISTIESLLDEQGYSIVRN